MSPLHLQVLCHIMIGHIFFTGHVPTVVDTEITPKLIPFRISTCCRDCPCTASINIAFHLQIHIVIDCKVIAQTLQVHTASIVIAKVWHDDTARILIRKWEETERYCQRQWHLAHYQVCRTKHHILLWLHLTFGHLQIEVWMIVIIAGGIFSAMHHQRVIIHLFRLICNQIAFALLCDHMANLTLLCLQVIGNLFRLITIIRILKHRQTFPLILYRIQHATRIQRTAIQRHTDIIGCQLQCLIFHLAFAVHICNSIACHQHRVGRAVLHSSVDHLFFLGCSIFL